MPPINNEAELWRSSQEESSFRSLHFAHKFHKFIRPDNAGISFQWGNMKVWRVGIRSKGAYSLNILFSQFRLPPGAAVFVYNADQTDANWEGVKTAFVDGWATQYAAANG